MKRSPHVQGILAFLLGGVLALGALPAVAENDPEDKAARPDASPHDYRYDGESYREQDRDRDDDRDRQPARDTMRSGEPGSGSYDARGSATGGGTGDDGSSGDEGSRDMR